MENPTWLNEVSWCRSRTGHTKYGSPGKLSGLEIFWEGEGRIVEIMLTHTFSVKGPRIFLILVLILCVELFPCLFSEGRRRKAFLKGVSLTSESRPSAPPIIMGF